MTDIYVKIRKNKKYTIIRSYDGEVIELKIIEKNNNTIETIDKILNPEKIKNNNESDDDTDIEMDYKIGFLEFNGSCE
jgi:hypothetical protein